MIIGNYPFADARVGLQPTRSAIEARLNSDTDSNSSDDMFKLVFQASSRALDEASAVSRENTALLLAGQIEDFPKYMIENEKPGILFDLNLSMRTKMLDAYSEIMKTQV